MATITDDHDILSALPGKTIKAVVLDPHEVAITFTDGSELNVSADWTDCDVRSDIDMWWTA